MDQMIIRCLLSLTLFFGVLGPTRAQSPKPVRLLVWDEQQPEQAKAYENFLGNALADHHGKRPGIRALSVNLNSPEQGLDAATLDATDVIVWWGHRKHGEIKNERVDAVVQRVLDGKLGFIALHSAHFAEPFMRLMYERSKADAPKQIPEAERATAKFDFSAPLKRNLVNRDAKLTPSLEKVDGVWRLTPPACVFPSWRADGAPSHVTSLLQDHPIAKGLPVKWEIPQTEMYDEPFHVPTPDAVIFEERWDKGEKFRSGCVWQVKQGRVFYFRPGHETYPVYRQAENLTVIENAVRWAAP
ncbi:ThuA domain-containing protein [Anatilimnocola floriformis]|uniref:ThuA domain-containing protein n=1 Tax=Anatilimnocola floriformis TaxID=2948575 RepID=UPI0020C42564|nr:ThuA domain-containing protein [Anatilimnocola floriformis]